VIGQRQFMIGKWPFMNVTREQHLPLAVDAGAVKFP
jgi:hypothetical protein